MQQGWTSDESRYLDVDADRSDHLRRSGFLQTPAPATLNRSLTRRPRYSRTLSEKTMIDGPRATDVLANERTFLAYLRTALSFIAFGFVIARFALFTREIAGLSHATIQSPGFSNAFGIAVAVFGTAIALFGGYRYVDADRAIRANRSARLPLLPALIITGIVAIIGFAVSAVLVLVR